MDNGGRVQLPEESVNLALVLLGQEIALVEEYDVCKLNLVHEKVRDGAVVTLV